MDEVRTFFDEYAAASLGADAKAIAHRYAEDFIVSGRDGSAAFKNDESFLTWLEAVFARNREVGMTSLEVASVHSTPLGDHHALATVEWVTTFEKTGAEEIRLDISYLLRVSAPGMAILAYVLHEDEEELMKAKGLI